MYRWNPLAAREPEEQPSKEDDAPSDSSESPPTLAERREAARPLRAVTRTASTSSSSSSHLTAQDNVRNYIRSRTPSPNLPSTTSSTAFAFTDTPAPTMSLDETQMQRMIAAAVKMALQEDRADRDRQSALHTEAAVTAALANQTSHVRAIRKPELPPLDKKNIDQWISRIEYAYTRAEVVKAKDKLAFLESKFTGCDDAQLNELLRGTTDADWTSFLTYLRDIYGRTKEDQVNSLLAGFPRESRRPQQLASHIRERIGKINLDDILKETLLREIPAEIRQHAATSIKDLDFQATADHLEIYFDKQGRVLNSSRPSTGINAVGPQQQQQQQRSRPLQSAMKQDSTSKTASSSSTRSSESQHANTSDNANANNFTNAFSDEDDSNDINAVRFRQSGQKQTFNVNNKRSQSRGRNASDSSSRGSNSQSHSTSRYSANGGRFENNSSSHINNNNSANGNRSASRGGSNQSKVCSFHTQYGDKARSCREWCMLWTQHQVKGQAST